MDDHISISFYDIGTEPISVPLELQAGALIYSFISKIWEGSQRVRCAIERDAGIAPKFVYYDTTGRVAANLNNVRRVAECLLEWKIPLAANRLRNDARGRRTIGDAVRLIPYNSKNNGLLKQLYNQLLIIICMVERSAGVCPEFRRLSAHGKWEFQASGWRRELQGLVELVTKLEAEREAEQAHDNGEEEAEEEAEDEAAGEEPSETAAGRGGSADDPIELSDSE